MELNIKIDEQAIAKEAQEMLTTKARQTMATRIQNALYEPRPYNKEDKGGYLYQMIVSSIDDKFLTEETQKFIASYISTNWESNMKEALDAAMKKRAQHMANKAVFTSQGLDGPRNEDLDRAWLDEHRPHPCDNMFDSQHMETGA